MDSTTEPRTFPWVDSKIYKHESFATEFGDLIELAVGASQTPVVSPSHNTNKGEQSSTNHHYTELLQSRFSQLLGKLARTFDGRVELEQLVDCLQQRAIGEVAGNVYDAALKVQLLTRAKRCVRQEIKESQKVIATQLSADSPYKGMTVDIDALFQSSQMMEVSAPHFVYEGDQFTAYIDEIHRSFNELDKAVDDARLALSGCLGSQFATLQYLSDLAKTLYETGLAVLSRAGA